MTQAAPGNDPMLATTSSVWELFSRSKESLSENITLGNSREPPANLFSGHGSRWSECSEVTGHEPKRLPSSLAALARRVAGVRRRWGRRLAGMSDWRMTPDLHYQVRGQNQASTDQQVQRKMLVLIVDTD